MAADLDGRRDLIDVSLPLDEAHNDSYDLPSNRISIYHTGPAWSLLVAAHRPPSAAHAEGGSTGHHAIAPVWHELGEKIYEFFDSTKLK
jgi:hypothetical protein